ncbi:carbohydrate ABC transporter membrane protein 2 (CUT1 family) [Orenia metallireducens]|jgi:lactose/L-arabinose transport system permease protein|uniref:Carbohydrate ABC transporter membrane protein 2, CUT1 family n=1 Tax=Orenia metallireducens TaxID=1413210 RepID=A0A285H414_9FIRM|nr:carbohydrate ABC transporter permease [Orenia metallireducens]PRX28591.1 carbohydrate ABC transporter membrane protein 2 (CUT1 family) [Orenia metallireducens]SNY30630.1 carbohydrate ABC transporter membrane protein 2, CUT1 family [Orenia metallireducens]
MNNKKEFTKILVYIFLGLGLVISIYPFYWMLTASTLNEAQIFKTPPKMIPAGNFLDNLSMLLDQMPIWNGLFNSLFVSTVTTASIVLLSALAGYAFSKFHFKGSKILFAIILLTMMIPYQVTIVPLFIIMMKLGWINSYKALIIPYLVTPFGVFLMRQQMFAFPEELIESARVDGCSELGIFFKIVLPNMLPACAALAIITFLQQWGNFMWPLIVMNTQEKFTMPLMLSMLVAPGQVTKYGPIMVGSVIGIIPIAILFIFFQKQFVSGMFNGSVKG